MNRFDLIQYYVQIVILFEFVTGSRVVVKCIVLVDFQLYFYINLIFFKIYISNVIENRVFETLFGSGTAVRIYLDERLKQ
jgi:hypothetical protein